VLSASRASCSVAAATTRIRQPDVVLDFSRRPAILWTFAMARATASEACRGGPAVRSWKSTTLALIVAVAAVARALANDPRIVLADEPTGNLDTRNAGLVTEIFEGLAHSDSRSVVMVTHNPELAARADRRVHVVDGRVVQDSGAAA